MKTKMNVLFLAVLMALSVAPLQAATLTQCAKFVPACSYWGHYKCMECVETETVSIKGTKDKVSFSAEDFLNRKPRAPLPEDFSDGSGYYIPRGWIHN